MPNIGIWEIVLIVLVLLLVFGPKRLPQIGRSMGRGMREFKDTVTDQTKEFREATVDAPKQFKEGLNPLHEPEASEEVVKTPTPTAVVTAAPAPTPPEPATAESPSEAPPRQGER